MKKINILLVISIIMLTALISLGAKPVGQTFFKNASGTITVSAPVELASVMREVLLQICGQNNNLRGNVKEKTYADALTELQKGESDLVLVNKKPSFLAEQYSGWNVSYFAATAAIIIVNESNRITNLKSTDLDQIFSGVIPSWQRFNGAKSAIHLVGLYPKTPGGRIFSRMVMKNEATSRYFFPVSTGSQVDIIVAADKNAAGFRMYDNFIVNKKVKLTAIDGIKPTPSTILSNKYPLTVRYFLCYNRKSKNKLVKQFIKYFKTAEFNRKITAAGLLIPKQTASGNWK